MKPSYAKYLQSQDWQQKRKKKLGKRPECYICFRTRDLDVHHVDYKGLTDVTKADLRIVCRRCHNMIHEMVRSSTWLKLKHSRCYKHFIRAKLFPHLTPAQRKSARVLRAQG